MLFQVVVNLPSSKFLKILSKRERSVGCRCTLWFPAQKAKLNKYKKSCRNSIASRLLQVCLNLHAFFNFQTTKAFLPHMQEIDHGHIVTVASVAGMFGTHYLIGYCTSKFGAVGFHDSLTTELLMCGKTGVKTTCLCPFMVDTPLIGKTSSR